MRVNFARWGNSVAVRIPQALLRELGATEGTTAEVAIENGKLVVTPIEKVSRYVLSDLLDAITEDNRHDEVRTGAAVGNEFA